MAGLFDIQAQSYAEARPHYPPSLFSFLSSLTAHHHRAWDVATGNGQAAVELAHHFKEVIATDISEAQLKHTRTHPNVTYAHAPAPIPENDIERIIGLPGSIDIITVAQALHWFDLPSFYAQAKHMLRNPGGIIAVWCYTEPCVNAQVDEVFWEFYRLSTPFWDSVRHIVDDEYRNLPFPFKPVLEEGGTGPVKFECKKEMGVDAFLTYLKSWSALQVARKQGVELLDEGRENAFRTVWGNEVRTVTWPVFLRVGQP